MPSRSLNVNVLPSGEVVHSLAAYGTYSSVFAS
jgi:hypothetical protein